MIEADKNIVVAGLYAKRVVDTAIEMSISVARLAEHTGIDEKTLLVLPDTLPGTSYLALMHAATELSGDPDFGLHVGERISPASYPVLGYTLMSCRNLSHAIAQVTRYESIIHNLGHFSLDLTDDAMTLTWTSALGLHRESSCHRERHGWCTRLRRALGRTRNPGPRFDLYPQFTRQDRRTPAAAGRARCLWCCDQ